MTVIETTYDQAVVEARSFGEILRRLRKSAGLNQAELAERAGLGQSAISLLEKGERDPTWETVLALSAALGVSCEAFRPAPRKKR